MKAYSYDNKRHNSFIMNNTQSPRTSFALHFSNDTTNTQPQNSFEKPLTKSQPKNTNSPFSPTNNPIRFMHMNFHHHKAIILHLLLQGLYHIFLI